MSAGQTRIEELRSQVNEHLYRYHVLDDPTISDAQFDALIAELRRIEEENPELAAEIEARIREKLGVRNPQAAVPAAATAEV